MKVMFSISAHGFGHGSLSTPVIEALWRVEDKLEVVLNKTVEKRHLLVEARELKERLKGG